MLPFRSGDPEPRGGSQHLHLNSTEFHPIINCLLSAFPRTAVNSLALKLRNPRVPASSYLSTCISAGLSGPLGVTKCSLKKGHCQHPVGITPHGYHLPHIDTFSGLQPDLRYEPREGMPVWKNWPNVIVSDLSCCQALHESLWQWFRLRPNSHSVANSFPLPAFSSLHTLGTEQPRLWTKCWNSEFSVVSCCNSLF